jgi:hypothetical protein
MATDDDTLAAILAEISEPSPTISPLKSLAKRLPASDVEIRKNQHFNISTSTFSAFFNINININISINIPIGIYKC